MTDPRDAQIAVLREALEEITNEGKVCENFELCHHVACTSSYASWAIADKALSTTPSDALKRVRAEVLEEVEVAFEQAEWGSSAIRLIRALKDAPCPR